MRNGRTDITEFQIPAGKVYLSPMIDCLDGKVISWSIGTRQDAGLVNTILDAAIETVARNSKRPVVHSDRGATSPSFLPPPPWQMLESRNRKRVL
jgi:transposase InsO family protein